MNAIAMKNWEPAVDRAWTRYCLDAGVHALDKTGFLVHWMRHERYLLDPPASLEDARDRIGARVKLFLELGVREAWEYDEELWCFCVDGGPQGHERFRGLCHPSHYWLCPACQVPTAIKIRSCRQAHPWGSTVAIETRREIETECCGAHPVHPNGTPPGLHDEFEEED